MCNKFNNLYRFEDFVLNVSERSLHQNERLIQLPPKVFDTLRLLVERHGKIVSKQEMLDMIWKDTFVEENNLSQNISTLRKVFGKNNKFIETVPRKGFRFVKPVASSAIERRESIQAGSNGYVVATQTQTHVVEETILDRDLSPAPFEDTSKLKNPSRNLLFGAGLAILLASVFGFVVYSFVGSDRDSKPKTPFASFDYKELTDTGNVGSSTISPDGKFVAFVRDSPDKTLTKTSLHLMNVESSSETEIKIDGDVEADFLQFSPDGNSIYFRSKANVDLLGKIYEISILGGKPELIADKIRGTFSVAPNGEKLTYCSHDPIEKKLKITIREIASEKETYEKTENLTCRPTRSPVFSPNEEKIAFQPTRRVRGHPTIAFLDLKTKEITLVETQMQRIRELAWHPDGKSLYINAYRLGRKYQLWNISYPEGNLTRVTSDGDAYRSLRITADGTKISANRLQMYSHIWILPEGDISHGKQLTFGENEISGLTAIQFDPKNSVLFTARRENSEGTWITDIDGKNQRRFGKKKIVGGQTNYAFSKSRNLLFFRDYNSIWKMKTDGSSAEKVDLGKAASFTQPAVSADEKWLYYVKRENHKTTIWRMSLENDDKELVLEPKNYSPERFASISPDGKYLAFLYLPKKQTSYLENSSKKSQKFGFLNLETKEVKVIEAPGSRGKMCWTNGGKSFDFRRFTKSGMAIFRKNIDDDSASRKILELENELIFNFDWSDDEKTLVIGRGNARTNVVVLSAVNRAK